MVYLNTFCGSLCLCSSFRVRLRLSLGGKPSGHVVWMCLLQESASCCHCDSITGPSIGNGDTRPPSMELLDSPAFLPATTRWQCSSPLRYRLHALNVGGLQLGLQTPQVEKSISLPNELTSLGYFVTAAQTEPDPINTAAHTAADMVFFLSLTSEPWYHLAGCIFVCWFNDHLPDVTAKISLSPLLFSLHLEQHFTCRKFQ